MFFFTFLLLLFFLLHSVLFVTSDFYLPLLLCTLAPAQALLLICFRSRCLFSCMSPNTILCISYFVQRNSLCIRHWSSNRITRKKTEERTTVFLEIVWRNFAMAMAVAARVNVHTATMSDFLSDIIWTELPNATNNEEQWNTRIHTKPNTEAVGTIAKRMKSNPMNLCHSRFNEKNHNIFQ